MPNIAANQPRATASPRRGLEAQISDYFAAGDRRPLFLHADCRAALDLLPPGSIDCAITSPPYWGHRVYSGGGIGQEATFGEYIDNLVEIVNKLKRALKPTGSFWLNIGDSYSNKHLLGIPWRTAIRISEEVGLTLRNDVIWHKVKGGPDNAKDKLRNVHEHVFHFSNNSRSYFYDVDAIRTPPKRAKIVNGAVVSATGVSGIRYERQIELSTRLSPDEKRAAREALRSILDEIRAGRLSDFRMIIRGQQRTTHSDATGVSGRARELAERGFYFLKYHPGGSKPGDVWDVIPEDTQGRRAHFAPFPADLCRIPIAATCPPDGIVLDPFCGTGTAMLVATQMGRRSIGIDLSEMYIDDASLRCSVLI